MVVPNPVGNGCRENRALSAARVTKHNQPPPSYDFIRWPAASRRIAAVQIFSSFARVLLAQRAQRQRLREPAGLQTLRVPLCRLINPVCEFVEERWQRPSGRGWHRRFLKASPDCFSIGKELGVRLEPHIPCPNCQRHNPSDVARPRRFHALVEAIVRPFRTLPRPGGGSLETEEGDVAVNTPLPVFKLFFQADLACHIQWQLLQAGVPQRRGQVELARVPVTPHRKKPARSEEVAVRLVRFCPRRLLEQRLEFLEDDVRFVTLEAHHGPSALRAFGNDSEYRHRRLLRQRLLGKRLNQLLCECGKFARRRPLRHAVMLWHPELHLLTMIIIYVNMSALNC
ncbi:hypothetical protein RL72_01582 [Microbacterium azadirachtae]|uniref:Uncharacterized protein n=1 Tax=Microbacterium azadirachtae TaxID=582680 RepID=A0A0F0KWM1_9MICO|nr:hypothetical protein RL72_01582 [Microbacterium azadirachtae]